MDGAVVDTGGVRAREARLTQLLSRSLVRAGLVTLLMVLVALSMLLILQRVTLGYLLLVPALLAAMYLTWYYQELRHLPAGQGSDLSAVLEWRVLAKLHSENPGSHELWQALRDHPHSRFFAARYGLIPDFFDQALAAGEVETVDMPAVWKQASMYREANQLALLDASCLLVALFKLMPQAQAFLNNMKVDIEEVESGIGWLAHVNEVLEKFSKRQGAGGIARDWTSGYTPLLSQIGHNLTREAESGIVHRPIESRRLIIDQMVRVLAQPGSTNIALVGEVGVGKTTAVYALAEELLEGRQPELQYSQIFSLDASTLIANTQQSGQLEQLILRLTKEAHHAGNVVLFFDEAQMFLEAGTGSVDLGSMFMQLLQNTQVRFIFAMTPQQWQRLTAQKPALAALMNYQFIPPTDQLETYRVLEDQVLLIEGKHQVTITYYALREAFRLAEHYISDNAFPGKALKLLEQTAVTAGRGKLLLAEHVQQTFESTRGIKVQAAGSDESAKLLNLEAELHQQMIGQESAVRAVANALRRARAGVRDTRRPIGTFLFLGPTGVGKTQLAKALADVYFTSSENMVRIDMNEYVNASDLQRLLAAPDTNTSSMTFLGKIRQQPFSVVLLDEIEKAHPDVINAFLQVLDEGRVADSSGNEVSFRDTIIIATSNAGADKIRENIAAGRAIDEFRDEFMDQIIAAGNFAPEFLNRFDEMVIFRPLTEDELVQVVTLMIADINKTLSLQKLQVELDEPAKRWLVVRGNDPRLGARPMRRMVQRYVEDTLARKVLEGQAQPGSVITLGVQDFEANQ